ncbi:MAG: pyridoxal phosphate-dependent aminotransferase [Candidatus Sumerlaeaceae bacterium]|nr:pyridoxal phosphate-dependent aminotransferase [Candidatus Sumerlaeaceae bacterium]
MALAARCGEIVLPLSDSSLLAHWGDPHPSDLADLLEHRRAANQPVLDLISANPHEHGLQFDAALLSKILGEAVAETRVYRPDARGQFAARRAIADYHGSVSAEQIILTPGTSFGYWCTFRLLGNPGDEILCPQPTYPLFDDLARLAGLGVRRYHLERVGGRWGIDAAEVEFQITPRTRAIVVVSPHNPTGSVASESEIRALAALARRHGLALIFDEVFREWVHDGSAVPRPGANDFPLILTLNGLSKMLSLPGLKAGWMVVEGDKVQRERFLNAAEYLSDSFLPVSEITQAAIPPLLREGQGEMRRLGDTYRNRMVAMVAKARESGMDCTAPQAGPYLLLPLPDEVNEEQFALGLVKNHGIVSHPGAFYGLPPSGLVATCVHEPPWPFDTIAEEISRFVA